MGKTLQVREQLLWIMYSIYFAKPAHESYGSKCHIRSKHLWTIAHLSWLHFIPLLHETVLTHEGHEKFKDLKVTFTQNIRILKDVHARDAVCRFHVFIPGSPSATCGWTHEILWLNKCHLGVGIWPACSCWLNCFAMGPMSIITRSHNDGAAKMVPSTPS